MNLDYNVVIIGAGPAGATCALALRNSGLKVALVDKSEFPRNKTCGDAIPGPTLKFLKEVIGESIAEFNAFEAKQRITASIIFLPNGGSLAINWKTKAYNSTRFSFDNFLLSLVKKYTTTTVHEGVSVKDITRSDQKIHFKARNSDLSMSCDVLVGSDGANSVVARTLNPGIPPQGSSGIAIRAYYENVSAPNDTNEFYLLKDFPGYFWIFPVQKNLFNVGLGVLRENKAEASDLKKYFLEIIDSHPIISRKFTNAKIQSKILGFKLPFGGKKMKMSGERFILTGDAARLVDPLQGHGIDKAIKSGMLAAQQIEKCFNQSNFSDGFISGYDSLVQASIGKELERNFRLMKIIHRFPWLITLLFPILKRNIDLLLGIFYKRKKPAGSNPEKL